MLAISYTAAEQVTSFILYNVFGTDVIEFFLNYSLINLSQWLDQSK